MVKILELASLLACILLCTNASSKHAHHHHHNKQESNLVQVPGKVRSFSFEEVPASVDGANKRTVYESLEEEFSMEKKDTILKAFKGAVGTILTPPSDESAMDGVKESLMEVLNVYQKSGGSLFKQVAKVMKVTESDFYKSLISQHKEKITDLVDKKIVPKTEWLNDLRDAKYRFLPSQKHHASEYTKDFYPDIVAYAMVFVAATVDLAYTGEVYKCQLSKELDLFRNDVETAIQALIFKRLNMLDPLESNWRWIDTGMGGKDTINFMDKYTKEKLCEKGCVLNDGDGKRPVDNAIIGVASSVLDDAALTLDFVDRLLVLLVDKKAFCFDGCVCPPEEKDVKIERGDYVKDFPWSCLGKPHTEKKTCKLLCGTYGESYNWCPTEFQKRASPWSKCSPANKETCSQGWYKRK